MAKGPTPSDTSILVHKTRLSACVGENLLPDLRWPGADGHPVRRGPTEKRSDSEWTLPRPSRAPWRRGTFVTPRARCLPGEGRARARDSIAKRSNMLGQSVAPPCTQAPRAGRGDGSGPRTERRGKASASSSKSHTRVEARAPRCLGCSAAHHDGKGGTAFRLARAPTDPCARYPGDRQWASLRGGGSQPQAPPYRRYGGPGEAGGGHRTQWEKSRRQMPALRPYFCTTRAGAPGAPDRAVPATESRCGFGLAR